MLSALIVTPVTCMQDAPLGKRSRHSGPMRRHSFCSALCMGCSSCHPCGLSGAGLTPSWGSVMKWLSSKRFTWSSSYWIANSKWPWWTSASWPWRAGYLRWSVTSKASPVSRLSVLRRPVPAMAQLEKASGCEEGLLWLTPGQQLFLLFWQSILGRKQVEKCKK